MFLDISFPTRNWVQLGVKRIVKEIPGESRTGVLAPEVLRMYQQENGCGTVGEAGSGDDSAVRKPDVPNISVTTEPLRQWEFAVQHGGVATMVTAYCREDVFSAKKPAVVYFHGGGWRGGSRLEMENPMRLLAQLSGAAVFSVEYRLAPEYMFPCATDDGWYALKYVYTHAEELGVDAGRITVCGDSAGGNIAAACARRDRNMRLHMVSQQILVYPVLSLVESIGPDYHFSPLDYEFDDSQAQWILPAINALNLNMEKLYTENHRDALSPDASPLLDNHFAGLPKTFIICAEYDSLTQQGKTYAARLAAEGVDTTLMVYRGTCHGFMTLLGRLPQATDIQKEIAAAVREDA